MRALCSRCEGYGEIWQYTASARLEYPGRLLDLPARVACDACGGTGEAPFPDHGPRPRAHPRPGPSAPA